MHVMEPVLTAHTLHHKFMFNFLRASCILIQSQFTVTINVKKGIIVLIQLVASIFLHCWSTSNLKFALLAWYFRVSAVAFEVGLIVKFVNVMPLVASKHASDTKPMSLNF